MTLTDVAGETGLTVYTAGLDGKSRSMDLGPDVT